MSKLVEDWTTGASRKKRKTAAAERQADRDRTVQDSAVEAAYRRGKADAQTIADNAINMARNEMAETVEGIMETMDREYVQGWMDSIKQLNRHHLNFTSTFLSMPILNGICRELQRGYDRDGRLPSEGEAHPPGPNSQEKQS